MRITAVTCVKNEGPFLLEWIAFNRVIGVTDFLFYSNDCTDGTAELLDALAAHGIVHHQPNPAQGRNYQMEALKAAKLAPIVTQADWVWIADVDEFLNIHVGDHTIPALIEACDTPHAISINFRFFANADIDHYQDAPVISQFMRTHNPDIWGSDGAAEVKTLIRHDFPLQYYGAHRPFFKGKLEPDDRPVWSDGAGRKVPHRFLAALDSTTVRQFPAKGARSYATLNHYALRSLDSYLVKTDRGDVNRENRAFDLTYWRERNDDALFEDSILRYLPALEAEINALKSRPNIADLHAASVTHHRAKIETLSQDPAYQSLRAALKAASKLPPAEEALLRDLGLFEDAT